MKRVITYGTFDTFHYGHIRLLERASRLGDELIVGVSTDRFNAEKGKTSHFPFEERSHMVSLIRLVSRVIPEDSWDQKRADIIGNKIDVFVMGDDWRGKFDFLSGICEVVYLERTPIISSNMIRDSIGVISPPRSTRTSDLEKT